MTTTSQVGFTPVEKYVMKKSLLAFSDRCREIVASGKYSETTKRTAQQELDQAQALQLHPDLQDE